MNVTTAVRLTTEEREALWLATVPTGLPVGGLSGVRSKLDAAVERIIAAHLGAAWDEGWDQGHHVGYVDATDPDAPSFQRFNPYHATHAYPEAQP